jgi:hypothetical protein
MKIVVFGPERRLGALAADRVIDLNRGFARYLQYRGDRHPNEQAAKLLPAQLRSFIEGGAAALENAQQAIEYLANRARMMVTSTAGWWFTGYPR